MASEELIRALAAVISDPGSAIPVETGGGGSYLRLDDRTVWPNPADPNEVQWRLRYGTPSKADLLVAASMMAAYRELAGQTYKRRSQVVSLLRAALAPQADR